MSGLPVVDPTELVVGGGGLTPIAPAPPASAPKEDAEGGA